MNRRTAVIAAAAAGALVLGGTAAYADIVGPDNTINACVLNKTGAVRIVGPDKPTCTKSETALSWNQQGVPGEPGAPGLPGTPGAPGTPGTNGTNGLDGVSGHEIVRNRLTMPAGTYSTNVTEVVTVNCPEGKTVVGGGGQTQTGWDLESSFPDLASPGLRTWVVVARVDGTLSQFFDSRFIEAYAICADVTP